MNAQEIAAARARCEAVIKEGRSQSPPWGLWWETKAIELAGDTSQALDALSAAQKRIEELEAALREVLPYVQAMRCGSAALCPGFEECDDAAKPYLCVQVIEQAEQALAGKGTE